MRKMLVIGIGAGDPDYLTQQAVKALNHVDVFFVIDKGAQKSDLVELRHEILERFVKDRSYELVSIPDPERDRDAEAYERAVVDWRQRRSEIYERAIRDHLADGCCGAFLVWGDPTLYDSTLAILDDVLRRGISSVSALAAKHRTTLNRIGQPLLTTTGRRLSTGFPTDVDDVVVMLDAHCTFSKFEDDAVEIFWGAYIGTPDEILVSGHLPEVADRIKRMRAEARARKGWIMDTYLLRRLTAETRDHESPAT
jgi:precorrin-6A synthase